jgi:23S rRNA (cytosine1962-C5)-methyltransferase
MAAVVQRPSLIVADRWKDYQLLETGAGMKQEKWGDYTLVRPDPQIIWPRAGGAKTWPTWDGLYHRSETGGGQWEFKRPLPEHWEIGYALQGAPGAGSTLRFKIRPTSFKHTGLFPEQAVNWEWCAAKIGGRINRRGGRAAAVAGSPEPKGARVPGAEGADAVQVLNLFGYTGAATCAAV